VDSIREKILKEEAQKADSRKNLNVETVKSIWKNYRENNPSQSVQLALKNADIHLDQTTVIVYVPNTVSKDLILQESSLTERLRNELGTPELVIDIKVEKSRFPEMEEVKPMAALTQRERFQVMSEKNQNLGEFVKVMGLKLDADIH